MSATQAAIDALFAPGADTAVAPLAAQTPTPQASGRSADVDRILHLTVPVNVTLAERGMSVESILALNVGSILEFDKPFDAELTLCVGAREIGKGQAVKIGENFGLRVSTMGSVKNRIDAMGGAPGMVRTPSNGS